MKNFYRFLIVSSYLLNGIICYSQKPDSTLTLNSVKSPVSPGATLLGINSSEIAKPTDLTGVLVSVRNATNDFTTIPASFALDIAPKWLFDKKNISLQDYFSNKPGKNISQSFLISYAQSSQKDDNYDGLKQGVGIKFSIYRGKIVDKKYIATISKIKDLHKREFQLDSQYRKLHGSFDSTDEAKRLKSLLKAAVTDEEKIRINQDIEDLERVYNNEMAAVVSEQMRGEYADVVHLEETITPVRKGFILDFSTGTIIKYDQYKINASSLTNSSFWVTFGYDGFKTDSADNSYFTVLGLSRLVIKNADELYKAGVDERYTAWDNGVRVAFNTVNQKFTFSGEIISRRLFNTPSAGADFVTKWLLSAELQIGKNQRLSFTYGKDFENRITKDGNVIGLLNFVTGFFNKKTFENKPDN